MKRLINLIISSKTTLVLLIIFIISISVATFIENEYDFVTAKLIIYNAKWFELLLLLLVLNFIGSIKKYHLLRKSKLPGLLFHSAFIVIILGAGITRYIGFEGSMHIREGQSSNFIFSSDLFLSVVATSDSLNYSLERPLQFSAIMDNSFEAVIETKEKGAITINYRDYIKNAVETFEEHREEGIDIIELIISDGTRSEVLLLNDGEVNETYATPISFNNDKRDDAIKIISENGNLNISYPAAITSSELPEITKVQTIKDSVVGLKQDQLYWPEGLGFSLVLSKKYEKATVKYMSDTAQENKSDVLLVSVAYNGKEQLVPIKGGFGSVDNYQEVTLDDINVRLAYGLKKIQLPFSIRLNDFILERYAGSESPSSFTSEVTLTDKTNNIEEEHSIFMNNVLDYSGYRFFQASYDKDEKGAILTVNHDFYGTWISYFGYFLMALGFILTLFSPNSRYRDLIRKIKKTRMERKAATQILVLMFLSVGSSYSQNAHSTSVSEEIPNMVSAEHSEQFGHLIVQTYDGRFSPINTLAYDVMHKISRKDNFSVPGKGKISAMQVFTDLPIHTKFWKEQKMIYVRESQILELIGIQEGKYASFNDFFDQDNHYKLEEYTETAFRKIQSTQNTFDKEIIKVNERVEIFIMSFQARLLTIFPVQNSTNNKWISYSDPLASTALTGYIEKMNDHWKLDKLNYYSIMRMYLTEVYDATISGDYTRADKILEDIDQIQRQSESVHLIPSELKVRREIHFNKSKIFIRLKNIYAGLSIILLLLSFIDNLKVKKSNILRIALNSFIVLLACAFAYHTYGLGLRWYLSGHAPWSNGYEALLLVAWAGILAGFSFARYSKITLAATALLAFFTLMTASHSSYDPQLTNLQPVLKSYWLIIHVATLTISYGFFGLAFMLGLMNLTLLSFKNSVNNNRLGLIIKELTHINEINITIGLFLAAIGTFLGGIWANESWGRYWGWDAKETWALVIILTYTLILHFRLVPKMRSMYVFNVGAVLGFATVLMTFFGVNYYLSKGLHSYASGEPPVFPMWALITIITVILLIIFAGLKASYLENKTPDSLSN